VTRQPGRKHVIPPVVPLCFIDRVLNETGHLFIVLEPDQDILHHIAITGDPLDIDEIIFL